MQAGVLIANPYGTVSTYLLLKLLLERKYRVFCLVDPLEVILHGSLWDILKKVAEINGYEQSELIKVQHSMFTITVNSKTAKYPEVSQNNYGILKSSSIHSMWHCMEFYPWQKGYLYKGVSVSKYNERLMKNTIYLANLLGIADINVIHTGYTSEALLQEFVTGNEDSFFKRFKVYQNDKRIAEESVKEEGLLSCRIFRTPEIIGYSRTTESPFYNNLHYCLASLDKFTGWIYERLPDYFLRYSLTLYNGNCDMVNFGFADILVDEILNITEKKGDFSQNNNALEVYHVYNTIPIFIDRFVAFLKNSFPEIEIKLTDDFESLNFFDRMFQSKIGGMHLTLFDIAQNHSADSICTFREMDIHEDKLQGLLDDIIRRNRKEENGRLFQIDTSFYNGVEKTIQCRLGSDLVYYTFGDGPPLVLINAIGVKVEAFKEIIYYLSKRYKVITWECRGVSKLQAYSSKPCFVFSYEKQANDLEEILKNEAINQANLVGWCSGALIALTFYKNQPLLAKSLTLISGTYAKIEGKERNWIEDMREISVVLQENPKMARVFIQMINKLLFEIKKTDEYENGLDKVLEKLPPRYRKLFDTPYLNEEYLTNYCKIIGEGAKLDIKDLVKNIDVPVFIVSAKDDKIVSEKQFEWAKNNIKGIKSLCVSAATHWFLTENGEDAANELITLWSQMPEEIKWVL